VTRKDGGGRKEAWDTATREEAVRRALVSGPEAASRATGVPSGTVRSWLRRRAKREELDDDVDARLAAVQEEGRRIVVEREAVLGDPVRRAAADAEYERKRLAKLRWVEGSPEERESMERPD
jgi:hypothetical protein